MTDLLRAALIFGAFVNFCFAAGMFAVRISSWLAGEHLLGWIQGAVLMLHVVIALLCIVLAEQRRRRIPSPATDHRGRHDHS